MQEKLHLVYYTEGHTFSTDIYSSDMMSKIQFRNVCYQQVWFGA
jgi:hypothetical protein